MSFFSKFMKFYKGVTYYIGGEGTRSQPRHVRAEDSEICSAIIDCNAVHVAKGEVLHVLTDGKGRIRDIKRQSAYTKLFRRPNPMMTRQEFLYGMAWQLQVTNTAMAWIKWAANMQPAEIWPLVYLDFEVREIKGGGYAVQFTDSDGWQRVVRIEDLVVLRRKYDAAGYAGRNNNEISETLGTIETLNENLTKTAALSSRISGIIKNKKAMLSSANMPAADFERRLKDAAEHGGIVPIDAMEDYIPLEPRLWAANAAQMKQITDRVYTFWRTPEEVVRNTATEQMMQNYYDSIIEPVWAEMSDAFTNALFTRREQDFGNKIIITSGAATGASWQTKLNIVRDTKEQGLLTTNEYRELLGYSPVEDGDERFVSLNYIKSSDMSKYQTGKEGNQEVGNGKSGNKGQEAGENTGTD